MDEADRIAAFRAKVWVLCGALADALTAAIDYGRDGGGQAHSVRAAVERVGYAVVNLLDTEV